jgi:hypothetical protein
MPAPTVFHPDADLPAIAGTRTGPLLIVGPGACAFDDLGSYPWVDHDVMVVNLMGVFFPEFDHWTSIHSEVFHTMERLRFTEPWRFGTKHGYERHTKQGSKTEVPVNYWPISGHFAPVSGVTAAIIGVALGYDRVVLAGIPADDSGHFYGFHGEGARVIDHGEQSSKEAWSRCREEYFEGKVTSLSGNTREWLGSPDE